MPKNISKKTSLNVKRISEQRLIDKKIIKPREQNSFARIAAWSAALGFLVGGGMLGYLWFSGSEAQPQTTPNIIVPEDVTVNETSKVPVTQPPVPSSGAAEKLVEILDTETGYLNVREGPGTNYKKIREVKPKETYEFVSEDAVAGWYQIKFPDGSTGWVINKYSKIK